MGLLQSCQSAKETAESASTPSSLDKGVILHAVYFWLKEGITEEEEKDFLNFFGMLQKIPNVRYLSYGRPAPTNPREVVDNSFSYHLIVLFDTMDDINVYETHPDHIKGIELYSHYWTQVEVKDSVIA